MVLKLILTLIQNMKNLVESSAKQEIQYSVEKVLTDNKIYNSSISAEVEQNGDEILINRILVSVTDDYNVEEVKTLLWKI